MYSVFLALLIVSLGISAFMRARREGTWSWREFAITLLGVALILAVVLPVSQLLMKLGPDHAGLATVILLVLIGGSVALLTVYLSARRKRQKAATTPGDRHQEGTVAPKQKTKGH